ncbi:polysaccharide pyruvyl transferase family protein [Chitinophaga horti]|uniref:Polysaccharide pyruvyl transferase family protein n=1 Tax=Chitinophaga horti TaxID=2920382 RepID=A0ABY6IUU1_9BACT|nr:polysaccharide pyruvyl transferase family protein [Chitinophaga horti]UYQ91145.1 polysaccharide pyruvyl transferase family protein [Chitinophaga horti]
MYTRRHFLTQSPALLALLAGLPALANTRKKTILLRSSWQTVNIGDIGHTPGVITLIEKYIPEANVILWPSSVDNGVKEMLQQRFPKVRIVQTEAEITAAITESDFLVHGSGPSLVARKDVERWAATGKPYGIYGITFPGYYGEPSESQKAMLPTEVALLTGAKFAYFRDSISLDFARNNGVTSPVMGFAPDGAFAVDLTNEAAADAFMQQHGLEKGKFLCVIPRQRYTPYWEIPSKNRPLDEKRNDRNQEMREHDNAPIREAIIAIARQTTMKLLICPEDETQVKLGKEILLDKLPEDVKPKVVWRDRYWLTDEALSTYRRSAGLFGLEMHSPIMCIGHGVPAIVGRFAEQSSKGVMWKDIGLGEWLFDMDVPGDVQKIGPAALAMAKDPAAAKRTARKGQAFVQQKQRETMGVLRKALG